MLQQSKSFMLKKCIDGETMKLQILFMVENQNWTKQHCCSTFPQNIFFKENTAGNLQCRKTRFTFTVSPTIFY